MEEYIYRCIPFFYQCNIFILLSTKISQILAIFPWYFNHQLNRELSSKTSIIQEPSPKLFSTHQLTLEYLAGLYRKFPKKDKLFLNYWRNDLLQKLSISDPLCHKSAYPMEQHAISAHIFCYRINNMIYNQLLGLSDLLLEFHIQTISQNNLQSIRFC